ncbi:predicted protein [Nematostella vectensis]|uniref:Fibrinogen C-terminal domain-containing protein n=1 Tax=Nematostella vectensis TaxID=45351 RepID=A7S6T9_NEMVE|nr:predicted protein [Nematostella vectensis]|eukprot:XP_001632675.1 predicted protein [Nematostella vectensis]
MVITGYIVYLLMMLVCATAQNRGDCSRKAVFKLKYKGRSLLNHVIAEHDVEDNFDCTFECLTNPQCVSLNFEKNASSPTCELNNITAAAAPSSDLASDSTKDYYDATGDYVLPVCVGYPCKNGGTCIESCDWRNYECQCASDYTDENCQKWIGPGSSENSPAKSCLQILSSFVGIKRGNGVYWIQPVPSVSPFTVYCDMVTDGGGWTAIKKWEATSNPFSTENTWSDYVRLSDYHDPQYLFSAPTMLKLKQDMGYDQMRFYCYKESVKRVVHIMTNQDEHGYSAVRGLFHPAEDIGLLVQTFINNMNVLPFAPDVRAGFVETFRRLLVRKALALIKYVEARSFLTEYPSPNPQACESFTRLPDDTSFLSGNCALWGDLCDGMNNCNYWGHSAYEGNWRSLCRQAVYKNQVTMALHMICFIGEKLYCDDSVGSDASISVGDKFMLYVR